MIVGSLSVIDGVETPSLVARFAATLLDGVTLGLFAGGGRGILGIAAEGRQFEVTVTAREKRDAVELTPRHHSIR